jgi:DNA repair protein RadD
VSISLRYYQENAITALWEYFQSKTGNPIEALPTGTGKSVIIAGFLQSVYSVYPTTRVLMLTHVKELIKQNFDKLVTLWPTAPAGIYSAGLGRKEVRPITFAGIASVVKKAALFEHIDLVLIDECHLVSPHDETSYRNFIADLEKVNPFIKVIGFTATPYRLGQGLLTEPFETKNAIKPPLFTDICYDLTGLSAFNRLIMEGFLCKLVPKRTKEELDVSDVHMVAGEYNLNELQAAVDRAEITRRAIDETITQATGGHRQREKWLVFATGVEHAEHIAVELRGRGIWAQAIHSKMDSADRDRYIEEFKKPSDGTIKCLVNNNVLTTGFDCPDIDLIVVLRPTSSPGLWVQMLGRGTRPFPGKEDCLVLDFAGNTRRLGPINDPVLPKRKGRKGGGDAPVKVCEACGTYNHASVRFCCECGAEFPRAVKIKEHAASEELVKSDMPQIEVFAVDHVVYNPHFPRSLDKPPSLKVTYQTGLRQFSEWICLEHDGFAGKKARDWWRLRSADDLVPSSVEDAVGLVEYLQTPSHIRVWVNQKHPQIMAYDFSGTAFATEKKSGKPEVLDENVPF